MTHDASHIGPATQGTYPLRPGNQVRPLVDGEPAFRRICEAVEAATTSVWVTVAFISQQFRMPDDRGSFFDVLEATAARGVDVRVIFWSEPDIAMQIAGEEHFPACELNHARLAARGSKLRIRWDRVTDHCQHQKSWLIDAGEAGEVAFVGGINLDVGSAVPPGHPFDADVPRGRGVHDIYLEIQGPSASDVQHNFVQRWNEASERLGDFGAFPDLVIADDLEFPEHPGPERGNTPVQITRSILPGLYQKRWAVAGGRSQPYAIENGEDSILEQYLIALRAAERTIYFENQLLLCPKIISGLQDALARDVSVVVLVPRTTMPEVVAARKHPRAKPVFEMLASLGEYENFTFAGLAKNALPSDPEGPYEDIYVHAKFAAVDDAWATIGSANTMLRSFRGDVEMNASFWDAASVKALRRELLLEHLGEDTRSLGDREAFALYREVCLANRERRLLGEPMQGNVFAMDPACWAMPE